MSMEVFFNVIHRYTPLDAVIGLTVINGVYVTTSWYQRRYIEKLFTTARAVQQKGNVYARITPLSKPPEAGRGTERQAIGSSVLYLDYDNYKNQIEGLRLLQALPKPPTLIVNSGNGLHAYWLLDKLYTDIDALKARNKQLALDINRIDDNGGADSCYDLARVLRVPETYNVKQQNTPLECCIVEYIPDRVYQLDQFEAAPLDDESVIDIWDSEPLPGGFIESLRERDSKLAKRILSEEGAKKQDAPLNGDGRVDRSRNDAYIVTRGLALGYSPGTMMSVLMSPDWFSGAKYHERKRFDYVVMTVNNAYRSYINSPDRYFAKTTFIPDKMASELTTSGYLCLGSKLWRYQGGVYCDDAEDHIKAQIVKRLGRRWSSRYSDETLRYIMDQSRTNIDKINQHPGLVNVANGMLDLATGEMLPHDSRYYSTYQLPITYDPNADTRAIDAFIGAILPDDTIDVFWEYIGSTFVRDHYWPKAFLALIGPRDCGKSKVIEWLLHFFGHNNIATKTFQTLADNRFAAAKLFGKLANIYDDLDDSEAQNCGLIKALTGDTGTIDAEEKFKDSFPFKNVARFIFTANDFIRVRSPDDAYFVRAHIIKCSHVFTRDTADPRIVDKMITPANLAGGLNRALDGLRRVIKQNGFSHSESIAAANREYRINADTVSGFLHTCEPDPSYFVPKQIFYQMYRATVKQAGREPVSADRFFKRIQENLTRFGISEEYKTMPDGSRAWCYVGRKLETYGSVPYTLDLAAVN